MPKFALGLPQLQYSQDGGLQAQIFKQKGQQQLFQVSPYQTYQVTVVFLCMLRKVELSRTFSVPKSALCIDG